MELAGPDGAGLSIVINPSAGPGRAKEIDSLEQELGQALPAARTIVLGDGDDLLDTLEGAAQGRALGIVGGDGSVNAAATTAIRHGIALAVFPGGTLNHFARDVGLGSTADTAEAVRSASVRQVDVGIVDGQAFLNTASFGAYAALVDERERLQPQLGKWPAMAIALVKVLRTATPHRVVLDGIPTELWLIFVGNGAYRPTGMIPARRDGLLDGLLDIRYVTAAGHFTRAQLVTAVLTGQLRHSRVFHRRLARSLQVRSVQEPLRLACDGETFDAESDQVTFTKRPAALTVYAP